MADMEQSGQSQAESIETSGASADLKQENRDFRRQVLSIAVPASLQTVLQVAVLSITDTLMVGQLGSVSVAAAGLASKVVSSYTTLLAAVSTVAGIMIAQAMGGNNKQKVSRSFTLNIAFGLGLSLVFYIASVVFPMQVAGIYTNDAGTQRAAAQYLSVIGWSYFPVAIVTLLAALFRCMDHAKTALYVSIVATVLNIVFTYLFVFGSPITPKMGVAGAAMGTTIAETVSCLVGLVFYVVLTRRYGMRVSPDLHVHWNELKRFFAMIVPSVMGCVSWVIADNVYAAFYGNMGTKSYAAVALVGPVQMITVGLFTGMSVAASVIVAKTIGQERYDLAYRDAKRFVILSIAFAVVLGLIYVLLRAPYVTVFNVEHDVRVIAQQLIVVWAVFLPVRILNSIVGGNILRSGGDTKTMMFVDTASTWLIGIPLAFISVRVLGLSIVMVNVVVAFEEVVRLVISLIVLGRKRWMYASRNASRAAEKDASQTKD
ncbi:MAG TPA: hypothetical protein DEP29_07730 [Bifidobacterium sp.]|nr:hypothetical protein [Bifidobacterium sp.]